MKQSTEMPIIRTPLRDALRLSRDMGGLVGVVALAAVKASPIPKLGMKVGHYSLNAGIRALEYVSDNSMPFGLK